jgi:hypothetical protein
MSSGPWINYNIHACSLTHGVALANRTCSLAVWWTLLIRQVLWSLDYPCYSGMSYGPGISPCLSACLLIPGLPFANQGMSSGLRPNYTHIPFLPRNPLYWLKKDWNKLYFNFFENQNFKQNQLVLFAISSITYESFYTTHLSNQDFPVYISYHINEAILDPFQTKTWPVVILGLISNVNWRANIKYNYLVQSHVNWVKEINQFYSILF